MRTIRFILLTLLLLTGVACKKIGIGGHEKDYAKAVSIPKITVPPGANPPKQKPFYALPNRPIPTKIQNLSLVPPGSKVYEYRSKGDV